MAPMGNISFVAVISRDPTMEIGEIWALIIGYRSVFIPDFYMVEVGWIITEKDCLIKNLYTWVIFW